MSSVKVLDTPEPAVDRKMNPRVAFAVTLVLVFLTGAAAGAVAHNLMHHPTYDTAVGRALYFERLQRELNLTPAQSEQMQSVLNDFWQYYRTVLSESKQRVEQILDAEQRKKFERILQEHQPR
jgi:hypothetical protein